MAMIIRPDSCHFFQPPCSRPIMTCLPTYSSIFERTTRKDCRERPRDIMRNLQDDGLSGLHGRPLSRRFWPLFALIMAALKSHHVDSFSVSIRDPLNNMRRRKRHSPSAHSVLYAQKVPFSPLDADNTDTGTHPRPSRKETLSVSASASHLVTEQRVDRRTALASLAALTVTVPAFVEAANAAQVTEASVADHPLERLSVGQGQWVPATSMQSPAEEGMEQQIPGCFITYMTRFLLNYDRGINEWWNQLQDKLSLLSESERLEKSERAFASLAKSIEQGIAVAIAGRFSQLDVYGQLYEKLWVGYASSSGETQRQLQLLFSLLPARLQPYEAMKRHAYTSVTSPSSRSVQQNETISDIVEAMNYDLTMLLPESYQSVALSTAFAIRPTLPLTTVETFFDSNEAMTLFGPLAATPLTREKPKYGWETYALFGLSGATGCAITHSVVIPLDVVKTRAQTDPDSSKSILQSGKQIYEREGVQGLLLGAQATLAGYFWYGLSVYPTYAFFKRFLTTEVLSPPMAMSHTNDIALVAGAIAAVVASLGLTPLEAARIRAVAEPETYQPLGLTGTLSAIAKEDQVMGWKTTYAGLPSLMTRQVIFGSVKFLAFERACDYIFLSAPFLRDATWTSLLVSLVAGGFSGALSSIVSQPADSVLTYVAKNSEGGANLGLLEGARVMVEEDGIGSLFRGLGSRCVWAGSIIAGQFLLYDVFRTSFGVTTQDLSQVFQVVLPDTI